MAHWTKASASLTRTSLTTLKLMKVLLERERGKWRRRAMWKGRGRVKMKGKKKILSWTRPRHLRLPPNMYIELIEYEKYKK